MSDAEQKSRAEAPPGAAPRAPRYAVIFRTHFWDEFTQRQYGRLGRQVGSGEVHVLVDETRGHVAGIPTDRVFRLTDDQILAAGYIAAGEGSIQWYSGDVPIYMFYRAHPDYDYYVQLEYDVNVHKDLDGVVGDVARDQADIVALTKGPPAADWDWLSSCLDAYDPDEVRHQLICLSIFSSHALRTLAKARLEQADRHRSGAIKAWPFCEGYVATEAGRHGLRVQELSKYGDVAAYDWWPPYLERDLARLGAHTFVHPVLDKDKYVPSLLRNSGPKALMSPFSRVHRRLRRLGACDYARVLLGKPFREAFLRALRRRLGWSASA